MAVLKRVCEMRHRPIREINADVPAWLENLIDRLLAKEPADRLPSAAVVADLLECGLAHVQQPATVPPPEIPAAKFSAVPALDIEPAQNAPVRRFRAPRRLALAAAFALLFGACLGASEAAGWTKVTDFVATILRIKTPEGTLVIECSDPNVQVRVDKEDVVIAGTGLQEVRLRTGSHRVQAFKDGQPVKDELVSIMRGGKELVTVSLEPSTAPDAEKLWRWSRRPHVFDRPAPTDGATRVGTLRQADVFAPASHIEQCMVCHGNVHAANALQPLPIGHPALPAAPQQVPDRAMVWGLAFSPDGSRLAIGQMGIDGRPSALRVWSVVENSEIACLTRSAGYRCVAFSPDGRSLAAGSFDGVLTLTPSGSVVDRTEIPLNSPIGALAFLPSGDAVVTGAWDGVVRFHYFHPGNPVLTLQYPDRVLALAISPDGSTLAVSGKGGTVQVHELPSGKIKATLEADPESSVVESLDFSPDGKRLAGAGGPTARLWDTATWKRTARQVRLAPELLCVKFSRDGRLLAISDGDGKVPHYENMPSEIVLWDVTAHSEARRLKGHTNGIWALAFSPDGKTLASGSMDQTIKIWDVATGRLIQAIVPGESSKPDSGKRIRREIR